MKVYVRWCCAGLATDSPVASNGGGAKAPGYLFHYPELISIGKKGQAPAVRMQVFDTQRCGENKWLVGLGVNDVTERVHNHAVAAILVRYRAIRLRLLHQRG